MSENENIEFNDGKRKRFSDHNTDKRIQEHLTDESDLITEDDIRNVKTDESVTRANTPENLTISVNPESNGTSDDEGEADGDNKTVTPWDILNP